MSREATGDWFLTARGEPLGPVTREELEELVNLGGLHPRNDKVWKAGMAAWVAAGEIDGLFERRNGHELAPAPTHLAATAANAAPGAAARPGVPGRAMTVAGWNGVGRAGYVMGTMVLPVAGQLGLTFLASMAADFVGQKAATYLPLLSLVFVVIALYAVVQRFPNLGMSRWWTLGLLVPVLNWWLGYRMFACPPGYAVYRRLDGIGWLLAILYWLTLFAGIAIVVAVVVMFGAQLGDPELIRPLLDQFLPKEAAAGGAAVSQAVVW